MLQFRSTPITTLFSSARAADAGTADSGAASRSVAAVHLLNEQYLDALRADDGSWFDRHMVDDAVVVLASGRRLRKPEFLAALLNEPPHYRSLVARDVTLRAFGTAVQVDAEVQWALADGRTGDSRYIDTWVWLGGRWQLISAQITPLRES